VQSPRLIEFSVSEILLTQVRIEESLSGPYTIFATGYCENLELETTNLKGKRAAITLNVPHQDPRRFSGIIYQIEQAGIQIPLNRCCYTFHLISWFDLLAQRKNYRTFIKKSVLEISQEICRDAGRLNTKALRGCYHEQDYLAQYNESDYDFLRRHWQKAGIYYVISNEESGAENICLFDSQSPKPAEYLAVSFDAHIFEIHETEAGNVRGASNHLAFKPHDYLGIESQNDVHVTSVIHTAIDTSQIPSVGEHAIAQEYYNEFALQSAETVFRSVMINVPDVGAQEAIVTGHMSKPVETNERGEVRVAFPWSNQAFPIQTSSTWVPCLQLWSGQGYGSQFIPRIGDEVFVDYIEDIDHPVILGALHNARNTPIADVTQDKRIKHALQTRLTSGAPGHRIEFDVSSAQPQVGVYCAGLLSLQASHSFKDMVGGQEDTVVQEKYSLQASDKLNLTAKKIRLQVNNTHVELSEQKIVISTSGLVWLKAKDVPGKFPVAILGDLHNCPRQDALVIPHGKNPIIQGSAHFSIQTKPVARAGDHIACAGEKATITGGATNILVGDKPIAYLGGASCHDGLIVDSTNFQVWMSPRQT
jgi:uncharacterized protein involved in type VI secretion and phage assembly/uncharacterized Zn-binding protein involved in type VI secretion